LGAWELGSLGVWELGSLGAWELGSLGAWEDFKLNRNISFVSIGRNASFSRNKLILVREYVHN
jgi:hypothetical protein